MAGPKEVEKNRKKEQRSSKLEAKLEKSTKRQVKARVLIKKREQMLCLPEVCNQPAPTANYFVTLIYQMKLGKRYLRAF